MQKILFLCTGNYYRSRFSEHLFNHFAAQHELNWRADSRALALERGINNVGAISRYALLELKLRGISITPEERYPQQVQEEDFQTANLAIALDEEEHRPLMIERFPEWVNQIDYWLVHDAHITLPPLALKQIEKNILQLVDRLQDSAPR
ncbi:arsenate-mycothiol transferase ArsC [Calothrix sp. 336/3]|uniref:arsenate-mycothiol transferase ArsC n=1 Tax=Calothrix sp. 336/3 TaxID=1337936 RepID=UPI0004E41EED|nr:low molecular weight phosphatase family protein [Calothrix sp. 336/3]AKG20890.1 protein tyrosine phosphatase [Calothrix sp. 336/3]